MVESKKRGGEERERRGGGGEGHTGNTSCLLGHVFFLALVFPSSRSVYLHLSSSSSTSSSSSIHVLVVQCLESFFYFRPVVDAGDERGEGGWVDGRVVLVPGVVALVWVGG